MTDAHDPVGSAAEEAAKLLGAVSEWAREHGSDVGTAFGGLADQVSAAAHDVDVVDTVGAGDAFCGALGARLAAGASLREATVYANAAAALSVTKAGAEPSMPTAQEIEALLG